MKVDRRTFLGASIVALSAPLALEGPAAAAADALPIVTDGNPAATVVVADDADAQTQHAAQVLVDYVRRATGATLPQQTLSAAPGGGPIVYVGVAAPGSGVTAAELADLGQDAYLIRRSGDALTVAGKDGWGTRYGVYELCERYLGVRWLMTDDVDRDQPSVGSDVPSTANLAIPPTDIRQAPAMIERTLHPLVSPYPTSEPWDWEPGNPRVRTYTDTWGRYARLRHVLQYNHNLWRVISPRKFGDPSKPETYRPDFFPIHNGRTYIPPASSQTGWQPRFTADGIVEAAADEVLAYLRAHPDATAYSLSVNDSQGFSDDDLDTERINHLGFASASEHYYAFVNGIVERVAPEFPHVRFGVLAYTQVAGPPSFPLHPNIVPMLTKDLYGWTREDVRNADKPWVQEWESVTAQMGVWDYAWGNPYCLPRIYLRSLGDSFRYLRDHGVVAVMSQLSPGWGEGPKPWVYAKLLWDPDQDPSRLVHEWCVHAAGRRGAPFLQEYFDLWEEFWTRRAPESAWFDFSTHRTWFLQINADYLNLVADQDLSRAQRCLDRAAARAETPEQAGRVAALRTTFEYYRAGALSFPRSVPPPANQGEALSLFTAAAGALDRNLSLVQQRLALSHAIDGDAAGTSPYWARQSLVWTGWDLNSAWQVGQHIRAEGPGGPVRAAVAETLATTPSANVKGLAQIILDVGDGHAVDANQNPSFEPDLPATWTDGPGTATLSTDVSRTGATSLMLPKGWRGSLSWEAPVEPGLFRFQFHLHTPHRPSGIDGKIVSRLYDAGGAQRQQLSTTFSLDRSDDDWLAVAHAEMAQFDVVRAKSTLVVIDSPGLPAPLYIDDASIFQVPYAIVPPGAVVVEQDQFRISSKWAEVVDDPAALDGRAAKLLGSQTSWGVQYPLSRMPATGSYRAHARVRLDVDAAQDPDQTVLYLGAYRSNPLYSHRNGYTAATFADGKYHWITLSDNLTHDTRGMYVYFTGINGRSLVNWIYIDRLYLLPA